MRLHIVVLLLLVQIRQSLPFKYRDEAVVRFIQNTTEHSLNFDSYLSNEQLLLFISDFTKTFPELTRNYEIGRSAQNQSLRVLAISRSINEERPLLKPKVKLVANQFGNEALGRQLLVYLVQFLLENYPQNPVVRHLVDTIEIHVLFSMNPDGFDEAKEGECKANRDDKIGRFADRFDDRSHFFGEANNNDGFINLLIREGIKFRDTKNGTKPLEPEVEAVETWTINNQFVLSLNLHSDPVAIFFPYSRSEPTVDNAFKNVFRLTPDNDVFEILAYTYALNHPSMNVSKCNPLAAFGNNQYPVINAAFFNQTIGSMMDFNYIFANCFELALHLSCCAYPPREQLKKHWHDNKVALVNHLRFAHMGIKGVIRDSETNKPLEGVFVHVHNNRHPSISNSLGEYFRLLPKGKHFITFELPEYENYTQRVPVENHFNAASEFDIYLQKEFRQELKHPGVIAAAAEEERNCKLNQLFEGRNRYLQDQFETVPVFKYHNYEQMLGYMLHYSKQHPDITHLYKIGTGDGLPYAMIISTNPDSHELLKPEFKYVANHFGDDWIGKEMLLLLIKHLLESYGKDERITRLVNTTRIHIVPSLDPEAFEEEFNNYQKQQRHRQLANVLAANNPSKSKKNSPNGKKCVAPDFNNRTLPIELIYPFDGTPDRPELRPDDRIRILGWIDTYNFVLSGSLYDGQMLARIPFNSNDFRSAKTEEDRLFRELANAYVQKHKQMRNSKGCKENPCTQHYRLAEKLTNGTINGLNWKEINNTLQDYSFTLQGLFDIAFFISCERKPDANRLFYYWRENRDSLVNFMTQVHRGVKGLILDAEQNRTISNIETMVDVKGARKTYFYAKGDYFRLLPAGEYTITLEVEGYYNVTKFVKVSNDRATRLDFKVKRNLNAKARKPYSENTPGILELKQRVSEMNKQAKNCPGAECTETEARRPSRFARYSVVVLVLLGLVVATVYGQQRAVQKVHLRRGFQQLLNNAGHKPTPFDDNSPLDNNEMTLSKIAIVKNGGVSKKSAFENEMTAKKLAEMDEKSLNEDNIVLLEKS